MRELKQIYLILLVGVVAGSTAVAEKPNNGMVDMQKLFAQYYRSEAAQKQFNQDYAGIQRPEQEDDDILKKAIGPSETINFSAQMSYLKKKNHLLLYVSAEATMFVSKLHLSQAGHHFWTHKMGPEQK